jgi:hypothetical protein
MEALKNKSKLRNKKIQLRVGNVAQVTAVTVGSIELCLPSGLIMELKIYILFQVFPKILFQSHVKR